MPPLLSIASHFFLQIAVILLTYRLLWPLFRRLAQVQVVAIMVAGFLLGPSVLGWMWPAAQRWLFPTKLTIGAETFTHPNFTAIYVLGQLGLVLYMFLVGKPVSSRRKNSADGSGAQLRCPYETWEPR